MLALDIEKTVDLLNGIASSLGFIGAVLLYKFAPSDFEEPGGLTVEDAKVNQATRKTYGIEKQALRDQRSRAVALSKVGFAFVVATFAAHWDTIWA